MFNILLALADGEKHGYAIMLEVETNTLGAVKMGTGTLYGSIKRMLEAGLIGESDERPDADLDDQRRRYYALSGLGRRALQAEAQRLASHAAYRLLLVAYPARFRGEYGPHMAQAFRDCCLRALRQGGSAATICRCWPGPGSRRW